MSVTLTDLLQAIGYAPESVRPVLRQLATELVDERERRVKTDAELARIDKRFDAQAAFARDRTNDLQSQVSANDARHTRLSGRVADLNVRTESLTKDVARLQDFAGFGTVMGRTLPNPLPRWNQCLLERMMNAVVVRESSMSPPRESYVFDDFETAGRFVAAVLTQKLPVFDQAVGYTTEQPRQAKPAQDLDERHA